MRTVNQSKTKRRRGNGQGSLYQRIKGGAWLATWYDHEGRRREKTTGTTDKATADRILKKLVADTALRREGVIDPRADKVVEANAKPITDHLTDYKRHLIRQGRTTKHAEATHKLAERVADKGKIERTGDITPARVIKALNAMKSDERGGSIRTLNKMLTAIKSFTKWLVAEHRLNADPIGHLRKMNVATDTRVQRRAFTEEEAWRIIQEAEQHGKPYGHAKISGEDRALAYMLALGTGFRSSELLSLTPASFDLDADTPTVFLNAGNAKNRKAVHQTFSEPFEDLLPQLDAIEWLRPRIADKPADSPLFAFTHFNSAKMLRRDMTAARERWIGEADTEEEREEREESAFLCPTDRSGKRADFHALRHSIITWLLKRGYPLRIVQEWARHSDPKLTAMIYTHLGTSDIAAALRGRKRRPQSPQTPDSEPMRATGTDGPVGRIGPSEDDHGGDDGPGSGRRVPVSESPENHPGSRPGSSSAKQRIMAHHGASWRNENERPPRNSRRAYSPTKQGEYATKPGRKTEYPRQGSNL